MVFPVHTVKACGGMESIAAHIFGTRWGQSADASHGGKHVQYPLNKWLVGHSPGLTLQRRDSSLTPPWNQTVIPQSSNQ